MRFSRSPIALHFRRYIARLIFSLLRGLSFLKISCLSLARRLRPVTRPLLWAITHLILLPVYKIALLIRLRLSHVLISARGFFFLLFTNRYVLHAILLIISVATISSQLRSRNAIASEDGQHSLLYALVTEGQDQVVQENIRPELVVKDAHYLGAGTIQAVPHIDFDYTWEETPADLTIPGNIAAQPEPGQIAIETPVVPEVVAERKTTENYTVKNGDTVASIARRFGVNVGTIIWANELGTRASIHPGDVLKVPAVSGVLHIVKKGDTIERIARRYGADVDEVARANHLSADHLLALGRELVIPGVTPPEPARRSTPVAIRTDIPQTHLAPKTYDRYQELLDTSTDERLKPPDVSINAAPTTKFLWPTDSHSITQYYGWRHTGVDIDCDYTNAHYAAADGVVETAGWNSGGYGLQVIIDHQDGRKTRYAHASKLFVKVGDPVKRGQVIAMCGTTGRSTGTHLHFEVYVNGQRRNPLAYIK